METLSLPVPHISRLLVGVFVDVDLVKCVAAFIVSDITL